MKKLLTILLTFAAGAAAAETVIHAGKLFDASDGSVREQVTIVVEAGRIKAVEDGYRQAEGAVDLRGAFVSPGWIDMHVHIASETSPARYLERFTLEPADHALRATAYARRTLEAGFTTVRDLGTASGLAQSLRRAVAEGWVVGPRIFTAGKSLATTGGHADPSNGQRSDLTGDPGPADGVVNGVDDAYKAARARYKEGADLIKITATGGVLSVARSGDNPQFTVEEVQAIVAAARDYGFRVAAHAHGAEGMRRAVLGGVDSIEHGTMMTPDIMRLMRKQGTWYVPTISAGEFVGEKAKEDGYFPEIIRPKAAAIGPQIHDTFRAAYEAGVPIAFGTDCGVCPHGSNWKEFVYMVQAGMPVLEALTSATRSAATLLDQWQDLGSIDVGKRADIVALPDPRDDVQAFGKVHFVMKDGQIYLGGGR